jgi:hypothetical protein
MIRSKRLLIDGERPLAQRLGLGVAPGDTVQLGQVVETQSEAWMIRPERLLVDRDRPLVQRLGPRVASGDTVQPSQVVEAQSEAWMIRSERLLINGERPLVQRLGLGARLQRFLDEDPDYASTSLSSHSSKRSRTAAATAGGTAMRLLPTIGRGLG